MLNKLTIGILSISVLLLAACGQSQTTNNNGSNIPGTATTSKGDPSEIYDGNAITKSDAEWKAELSPEAYFVTRQHGTERPFTHPLNANKKKGTYYCIACGLPLFSSDTKFESGTGWPSFYTPIHEENLGSEEDYDIGYMRKEVHCARCGAHLGHVFEDAPDQPTGLRYCINGAALRFEE